MNKYCFEYLSEALLKSPRLGDALTDSVYEVGDTVVIEKEGRGIFLGRIVGSSKNEEIKGYNIVQKVDVSAYFDAIEKEKRKEEIAKELEERIANLDKMKRFEYYATLDKEFGELYEEFKNL